MNKINANNKDIQQIRCDYDKKCNQYRALGDLIRLYLYEGLSNARISFTDIQFRIKTFHSFFSKIKRKKYFDNPYEKIEDILGVRIICTFKEDIPKVSKIIETVFKSEPPENKVEEYKGTHQIVQLKYEICDSSSFYKKLKGLKAEIQIRTNVQHSWAEVSHKLNYKDEENVPTEFRETLKEISYTLSLIDKYYENLKKEKEKLKTKLKTSNAKSFDLNQEVNIDTLTTFLDIFYSERDSTDDIDLLFEDMIDNHFSFADIIEAQKKIGQSNLKKIEKEILGNSKHSQVGVVRLILSLFHKSFWKDRKKVLPLYFDGNTRINIIEKWQKTLKN